MRHNLKLAIESSDRTVLGVRISAAERNMFVAEQFLSALVQKSMENIQFQLIWWWYMVSTTSK